MNRDTAPLTLLCGLAMLIPLPWVDEYVERRVTRQLYQRVASRRGVTLGDEPLDLLVEDRSNLAVAVGLAVLKWPFKKLFKTVFYFLTLKDALDAVARAAHRATLLDEALERGLLPDRARDVRAWMDHALSRVRTSPVTRPLYRQARPPLPLPEPEDPIARAVRWLQRHGGGAVVLETFRARLGAAG